MSIQDIKNELMNFAEEFRKEMSVNVYNGIGNICQSIDIQTEIEKKKQNEGSKTANSV